MIKNKENIFTIAMQYAFSMGIFWCVKYIFFMFGVYYPLMDFIYLFLTCLVPVYAGLRTLAYKIRIGKGQITFLRAWQFGVLLYLFAAILVSPLHYIFYTFIAPPGFLHQSLNQAINILSQANADPQFIEAVSNMNISPIQMTIQGIFNNIFYGIILSIPVAWYISRRDDSMTLKYFEEIEDEKENDEL